MRIHNDGIAGAAASNTAPVQNTGQPSPFTPPASVTGGGGDQVDISSLSGNIGTASGALAGQESARVNQLAAIYSKGDYQVNSLQLSRALVSGAIAGGSEDGDN